MTQTDRFLKIVNNLALFILNRFGISFNKKAYRL
jgi:hypothetical protein